MFGDRVIRYFESSGKDEALYIELTQRELGEYGVMAMLKDFRTTWSLDINMRDTDKASETKNELKILDQ